MKKATHVVKCFRFGQKSCVEIIMATVSSRNGGTNVTCDFCSSCRNGTRRAQTGHT